MGDKLPENERPSFESIQAALNSRVSPHLQKIFTPDIQNDCSCPIESYDCDGFRETYYLSSSGFEKHKGASRLELPILPNISDADIFSLLKIMIDKAGNDGYDMMYRGVLYHPSANAAELYDVFIEWGHTTFDCRHNYILANDMVPPGYAYLIPEPEFFGVLAANVGGFGVFANAHPVLKVALKR